MERLIPLIINKLELVMTESLILPPSSKAIALTQGKFAIVDEADYEWLNQWKWNLNSQTYAVRGFYIGNYKQKTLSMHRLIIDAPLGIFVDHINGNGLDNRRCNLRLCTHSQNHMNRKHHKDASSKYKGVSWHKPLKKWRTQIAVKQKGIHLGYFVSEIEAALAYNEAARIYFGEFAKLNIIS